jgi:hypothetical protein
LDREQLRRHKLLSFSASTTAPAFALEFRVSLRAVPAATTLATISSFTAARAALAIAAPTTTFTAGATAARTADSIAPQALVEGRWAARLLA